MEDFWGQQVGMSETQKETIERQIASLKEMSERIVANGKNNHNGNPQDWSVKLKYCNKSPNENPKFAKAGDSGFDLRAWISESDDNAKFDRERGAWYVELKTLQRQLIHTGLYFEIPRNCEIQVRPRSGMALKHGISVCNTPGTVDSQYRNEVGVILINLSEDRFRVYDGDRIAQAVMCPVYTQGVCELTEVENISDDTDRGLDGFGSSGIR